MDGDWHSTGQRHPFPRHRWRRVLPNAEAWAQDDAVHGCSSSALDETKTRARHTQQALTLATVIGKSTGVPHGRTDRAQTAGH